MSRFQELIAAAQRVCELEAEGASPVAIKAAIGRLRTAVGNVVRRRTEDESVSVFAGVSMQTGGGFVELSGLELPATIPAAAAGEIGRNLIAAAATAETEATLVAELQEAGVEMEQIGALLAGMRRRRESNNAE